MTQKQMLDTIPKLKELEFIGRRSTTAGSTQLRRLEATFRYVRWRRHKRLTSDFHAQGIKMQLWWLPLAVEDGPL